MIPFYALALLAASAFTSATLLPGTSEAAFLAFLYRYPEYDTAALLSASVANGAGSMVSYLMARFLPQKKQPSEKVLAKLKRWGALPLLFAWLPIVGDLLPLAAGWLRLNWLYCLIMLMLGKLLRYGMILVGIRNLI